MLSCGFHHTVYLLNLTHKCNFSCKPCCQLPLPSSPGALLSSHIKLPPTISMFPTSRYSNSHVLVSAWNAFLLFHLANFCESFYTQSKHHLLWKALWDPPFEKPVFDAPTSCWTNLSQHSPHLITVLDLLLCSCYWTIYLLNCRVPWTKEERSLPGI